jgi:hypothetical protein
MPSFGVDEGSSFFRKAAMLLIYHTTRRYILEDSHSFICCLQNLKFHDCISSLLNPLQLILWNVQSMGSSLKDCGLYALKTLTFNPLGSTMHLVTAK